MKLASALLGFVSALSVGCMAPVESHDEGDLAGLKYTLTETSFAGTYAGEHAQVDFNSRFLSADVLDIVVKINGMAITALVDYQSGVIEFDGFAAENGENTQMLDEDRVGITEFTRALNALGTEAPLPVARLRGFVDTWSEFPTTLALQFQRLMDKDRSWVSMCAAKNTYQRATHDGFGENRGDDGSTLEYAYVSMHAAGPCSDGTYFLSGGTWQCFEPDHSTTIEYAYGNCFGRCGAGCGSSSQLTWDCLDHDECVRVGHSIASVWCDDEFTSTSDDWAYAPNC